MGGGSWGYLLVGALDGSLRNANLETPALIRAAAGGNWCSQDGDVRIDLVRKRLARYRIDWRRSFCEISQGIGQVAVVDVIFFGERIEPNRQHGRTELRGFADFAAAIVPLEHLRQPLHHLLPLLDGQAFIEVAQWRETEDHPEALLVERIANVQIRM